METTTIKAEEDFKDYIISDLGDEDIKAINHIKEEHIKEVRAKHQDNVVKFIMTEYEGEVNRDHWPTLHSKEEEELCLNDFGEQQLNKIKGLKGFFKVEDTVLKQMFYFVEKDDKLRRYMFNKHALTIKIKDNYILMKRR